MLFLAHASIEEGWELFHFLKTARWHEWDLPSDKISGVCFNLEMLSYLCLWEIAPIIAV